MQVPKSVLIVLIIAVSLTAYFNTLFFNFVWDDIAFILDNPFIKSFKFLPQFFSKDFWKVGVYTMSVGYYRPLLAASFMADYALWRKNPFGYHVTNVLLHTLVSVLVFFFVKMLLNNSSMAFFSALLFSVHPIHTESVSFISGRVDLITLIFFLLSLIFFLKFALNKKSFLYYLFSLICFFVSLLAKEMAITLPLIVPCLDYLFLSKRKLKDVIKNFPRIHLGFFVILGLYLLMRFYFIGWSFMRYSSSNFLPGSSHYWRIFTAIKILGSYIRLLIFPYNLKADYFFLAASSLFEPAVFIGLVVLISLVFIALKNIKNYPILSFSIIWFFITVLPLSNIIPIGNIFAERYMYIPSVGFCIAMGFLFSWLLKRNIKLQHLNWQISISCIFFLFIVALDRVTYERNKVWNNDFTLWYETAKVAPQSERAHTNLATAYYSMNRLDEAIGENRIALRLNPRSWVVLNNMGNIYLKKGSLDEAIFTYQAAIEVAPDNALAYYNLAAVYQKQGYYDKAIKADLAALENNPFFEEARYHLALSYNNAGRIDEAIRTYEEFLQRSLGHPKVHVEIGYLYYKKNDRAKAKLHWIRALEIAKDYKPAKEALGLLKN